MRDGSKICRHSLPDDVIYKEVVIVGNGPSGMVTSFMLAGNIPYLKDIPDTLPIDEMLKARLQNLPRGQNLLEVDLMELAEGLEGRSQNPVPLLVDTLLRPCADMGIEADSLIEWRYDVEKQIDHIVLGKGPPGGAWNTFPGAVRSLSPGTWLALPPHVGAGVGVGGVGVGVGVRGRVPARAVAAYCRRYVHACKLQKYFRNGVTVTHVTRAPPCRVCHHTPSTPQSPNAPNTPTFLIHARDITGRQSHYACKRLVLAVGVGDKPNTLKLPSITMLKEKSILARDLLVTERGIRVLAKWGGKENVGREVGNGVREVGNGLVGGREMGGTVMVVGSGVSAADAVRLARGVGLRVVHVHRTAADSLAKLSPVAYPEYCQVYKMMLDGPTGNHQNYTPYPEHAVLDITPSTPHPPDNTPKHPHDLLTPKRVKLLNLKTNQTVELTVSLVAVLIGSKPDLFFLQTNLDTNLDKNLDTTVKETCIKCMKKQEEDQKQCFIKNHWHYIKSVLEQSIQSCKSKYLNYEINGNDECILGGYEGFKGDFEGGFKGDFEGGFKGDFEGVGWGVVAGRAVDGRGNPLAVEGGSHLSRRAEGVYALGPLTADNFMRFIPGGAVAIVSHIHKQRDN